MPVSPYSIASARRDAQRQRRRCDGIAAPASEPPQVDYTIVAAGDEAKLEASIAFSCQAEKIIFELSLRNVI